LAGKDHRRALILATRFNGTQIYINAELIQTVESTPDTVVTLVNETKMLVREPAEEILRRIMEYRREITRPTRVAHSEMSDGS
jgi:flagellar protein FlbD